ncbi:MAG: sigma-70 family RNA polymerase sigma factor [Ignavibacteria bacterium]|nr:sigma-70 family RNA polymerase sigma factor [Ignavibacteria bacterium]
MDLLYYREKTDEELILLFQADPDIKLFDELVFRYKDRILNFVFTQTRNFEEAEDLTQESFIKLYKYKDNFRNESKFSTWFYTIVTNTVRNHYSKKKNFDPLSFEDMEESDLQTETLIYEPDDNETDDDHLRRSECLQKAFTQLDPIFKEAILLRFQEEYEYE